MALIEIVPATLDLRFVRGDDFSVLLTFKDQDGVAIDMSDSTYRAQLRRVANDGLAVSFGVDDTSASAGNVVLHLSQIVTADLSHRYVWDVERVYTSDGAVQTLMAGEINVLRDVTRP
jgi:hypothetical protein